MLFFPPDHIPYIYINVCNIHGLPRGWPVVKNPPAKAGNVKIFRFDPWVGNIPWSRKWPPAPLCLLRNPVDRGDCLQSRVSPRIRCISATEQARTHANPFLILWLPLVPLTPSRFLINHPHLPIHLQFLLPHQPIRFSPCSGLPVTETPPVCLCPAQGRAPEF